MNLDEMSKEIIKTFNFDDVFNPDLTDDEKITYYEGLLEEARELDNKVLEDEIASILSNIMDGDSIE